MVSILHGHRQGTNQKANPSHHRRRHYILTGFVVLLAAYYIIPAIIMTPSATSPAAIKRRIANAIKGAFVADAASMGTHWTYDPAEMLKLVTSKTTPEFRDPPSPSFYSSEEFPGHYSKGMLSPYGEQMLFATEYVADKTTSSSSMVSFISGEDMSDSMLKWGKSFGGRPDHALTTFIGNIEKESKKYPDCGADDDQAHIYMKIVPVVGRYAGSDNVVENVVTAIRVHQNNPTAFAFGIVSARLLEAVILGAPLHEALETVQKNMAGDMTQAGISDDVQKDVQEAFTKGKQYGEDTGMKTMDDMLLDFSHELMKGQEDSAFYDFAGRSCKLPGSFIGPVAMFYRYGKGESVGNYGGTSAYEVALRENILASGDTCSRAVFLGSVFAAANDYVPSDWSSKVDEETMQRINAAIETIVGGETVESNKKLKLDETEDK